MKVSNILQEAVTKIISKEKKCKKAEWLSNFTSFWGKRIEKQRKKGKIYPSESEFQRTARR